MRPNVAIHMATVRMARAHGKMTQAAIARCAIVGNVYSLIRLTAEEWGGMR